MNAGAVDSLHVTADRIAETARDPDLTRVTRLTLSGAVSNDGLRDLPASPYLGALEHFEAGNCNVGVAGIEALADASWTAGLFSLSLWKNLLGDAGAAALFEADAFHVLEDLNLFDCGIGPTGMARTE